MLVSQLPWIERTFTFDFPAGVYPLLYERLKGTPARLEEMLGNDPSEERICLKPEGKWSVKEQIGHLIDLEILHDGRLDDYLSGKSLLRAADMGNKVTHEAHYNQQSLTVLLNKFRHVREAFVKRLDDMDDQFALVTAIHPRLQTSMRVMDMVYFICEHDDHHLAKIRRLLSYGKGR